MSFVYMCNCVSLCMLFGGHTAKLTLFEFIRDATKDTVHYEIQTTAVF